MVQHREKSYALDLRRQGRATTARFTPSDVRQNALLIITLPRGITVQILTDGINLSIDALEETIFIHNGRAEQSQEPQALKTLNAQIDRGDIILPKTLPYFSAARIIHRAELRMEPDEVNALRGLAGGAPTSITFEVVVTETGQVIEVRQVSAKPQVLPAVMMRSLEDAAMRFSFEPYVTKGKAQSFRTTITLELP